MRRDTLRATVTMVALLAGAAMACGDGDESIVGSGAAPTGDAGASVGGGAGAQPTGGSAGAGASQGGGSTTGGSTPAPSFATELTASEESLFTWRSDNGGSVTLGAPNSAAADDAVAELLFAGDPALGPEDLLTPEYATEIATRRSFQYGRFLARFELARCSTEEELVNGVFTYFNDDTDHDDDGLIDNSEIDIEVLCSDPSIISLTIWTEYTSDASGENHHVTREIDTTTGNYEEYRDYDIELGYGNEPMLQLPGFGEPGAFCEMGFEWQPASVRYFILWEGQERTLWHWQEPGDIPSLPASFYFNVWHARDWWNEEAPADYPAADGVMRVDWLRYWAL